METAEELVDRLCDTSGIEYCRLVHALYEAAVAKGAEQMKETIRKDAIYCEPVIVDVRAFTEPPYPENPMVAVTKATYTVLASVLDPKKAQHKIVEKFVKDIDDIMIQAINFRPDKVKP